MGHNKMGHENKIIYTNSDKCDITNYRPISNLSVLSKVLERVISKQLAAYLDHLDTNSLSPKYQSAYLVGHLPGHSWSLSKV